MSHDKSELHETRRSPDLEALKLWKDRSGGLLGLKARSSLQAS